MKRSNLKGKTIPFLHYGFLLRWYQRQRRICSSYYSSKSINWPERNEMIVWRRVLHLKIKKSLIATFLHYVTVINYRVKISIHEMHLLNLFYPPSPRYHFYVMITRVAGGNTEFYYYQNIAAINFPKSSSKQLHHCSSGSAPTRGLMTNNCLWTLNPARSFAIYST